MMKILVLFLLNTLLFERTNSLKCQVCDSTVDSTCADSFVIYNTQKFLRDCPASTRYCSVCIITVNAIIYPSNKLYSRLCAVDCNKTTVIQPGYVIVTDCCSTDNCNYPSFYFSTQSTNPNTATTTTTSTSICSRSKGSNLINNKFNLLFIFILVALLQIA